MTIIKISDLNPVGSKLFNDSENFMSDLVEGEFGEEEFGDIYGGRTLPPPIPIPTPRIPRPPEPRPGRPSVPY